MNIFVLIVRCSRLQHLFYSILFYSILFYSILFYSVLFYSILFYSILFYSILILSYPILSYPILSPAATHKNIVMLCVSGYREWKHMARYHLYGSLVCVWSAVNGMNILCSTHQACLTQTMETMMENSYFYIYIHIHACIVIHAWIALECAILLIMCYSYDICAQLIKTKLLYRKYDVISFIKIFEDDFPCYSPSLIQHQ